MFRIFAIIMLLVYAHGAPLLAEHQGELLTFPNQDFPLQVTLSSSRLYKVSGSQSLFLSNQSTVSLQPFNVIYWNGTSSTNQWRLEIRFQQADGGWSDWKRCPVKFFDNGRFWAKAELLDLIITPVQYRVIDQGVQGEQRLIIYWIEGVDNTQKVEESVALVGQPPVLVYSPLDSVPRPYIYSREQWGAMPPAGTLIPHVPYRMTLHHTAMSRATTFEDGAAEMRVIQDFHINGRGWKDIAYHFLVDDSGRIYQGTPQDFVGTHTGGANTGNLGVSMMGNFEEDRPPDAMIQSVIELFSYLAFEYHINPDSIFGHKDFVPTTLCPGKFTYVKMGEIRNQVRRALALGAPYVTDPEPAPYSEENSLNSTLSFHIKDDEEGVDRNSIQVRIDGELIEPSLITGDSTDYWIRHRFSNPLPNSKVIEVEVYAQDLATPPDSMVYVYTFKTITIAAMSEVFSVDSLANGAIETEGIWFTGEGDVSMPGLVDGDIIIAVDTLWDHRARIYPNISESGNYQVAMSFDVVGFGINAHYRLSNSNAVVSEEMIEYNGAFVQKWGQLGNGPVFFEAGQPSTGYIELLPILELPSLMIIDAFRFEKIDVYDPPAIPELKYVRRTDDGAVEVAWYPSLEGDVQGYRLYQSSDGSSWGDALVDESVLTLTVTTYRLPAPPTDAPWYYRIVAVDTNAVEQEGQLPEPLVSEPSDTYGICTRGNRKVLVVDNFDRLASWSRGQHFFVRSYGDALATNGVGFESCVNDAVQSGEVKLEDYDIVIYFCGDDSDNDESVAFVDQVRLWAYLRAGGKLFITGSEIGYDLGRPGRYEQDRLNFLFKANYVGDDAGIRSCEGAAGTVFEGLTFDYGETTEDTYIEDWPDYVSPFGGSEVALYYQGSDKVAAIQYTGPYNEDSTTTAQLFYLAFAYETIYPERSRAELMERILNYFGVETTVDESHPVNYPIVYSLHQNYPNPFNPTTTIEFELPKTSRVTLAVFNVLGQKVITLQKGKLNAGHYTRIWDGRNALGQPVTSGVYFAKIEAGDFAAMRKMVLSR